MAEHIGESEKKRGVSERRAEEMAWRTVHKWPGEPCTKICPTRRAKEKKVRAPTQSLQIVKILAQALLVVLVSESVNECNFAERVSLLFLAADFFLGIAKSNHSAYFHLGRDPKVTAKLLRVYAGENSSTDPTVPSGELHVLNRAPRI
jgi:hypothetical protein